MTTFELASNQLRVTDPCYTKDTWCAGVLSNVLPGKWVAEKIVMDDSQTGWGDRISQLQIWHEDYLMSVTADELSDIHVGVDSGQAGFFDESQYPEGETGEYNDLDTFYGRVCAGTAGEHKVRQEPLYSKEMIQEMENTYSLIDKDTPNAMTDVQVRRIIDSMKAAVRTRSEPDYLGIANVGFGVATHSGYGDGGYNCYVGRNEKGEIVAARIVFIGDEEDVDTDEDE